MAGWYAYRQSQAAQRYCPKVADQSVQPIVCTRHNPLPAGWFAQNFGLRQNYLLCPTTLPETKYDRNKAISLGMHPSLPGTSVFSPPKSPNTALLGIFRPEPQKCARLKRAFCVCTCGRPGTTESSLASLPMAWDGRRRAYGVSFTVTTERQPGLLQPIRPRKCLWRRRAG